MAPLPAILVVWELGQTTLDFSSSSTIWKKPGKPPKPTSKVPAQIHRQWMSGSLYESQLACQFEAACIVNYNSNESDPKGFALHRHSYSQELKLSAIEWAGNTYIKGKKDRDLDVLIPRYAAAKRLGITLTMLRNWIRNRACIANQKRGSQRSRIAQKGREDKMERALFEEFKEARKLGKAVRA
jgi:hypothetical protein